LREVLQSPAARAVPTEMRGGLPVARPSAAAASDASSLASGSAGAAASALPADPLVNDPALQNLYLAAERAGLDFLYLPLLRQLGLSSAQREAFRDLLMRRHEQRMDLADIQESHGLAPDDPALWGLRRKAAANFDLRQSALLGAAGYQAFNEYERILPVRRLVGQFAGALALEGEPLSPAQAGDLTRVLAEASPPYGAGAPADPDRMNWPVVVTEAAGILSEPQQRSFMNMLPRYPAVPP
jgi:hypothetical protein